MYSKIATYKVNELVKSPNGFMFTVISTVWLSTVKKDDNSTKAGIAKASSITWAVRAVELSCQKFPSTTKSGTAFTL